MRSISQRNFVETFLQEAEDLLAEIEAAALELQRSADLEIVHRLFRAFHTIKGSSGMCGITSVTGFTHHLETLLDRVRSGEVRTDSELADLVLGARDYIQALLGAVQGAAEPPAEQGEKLIAAFTSFAEKHGGSETTQGSAASQVPVAADQASQLDAETKQSRTWKIRFRPDAQIFVHGGNPAILLRELAGLGDATTELHLDDVPELESLDPTRCYLWWTVELTTEASENEIRDLFMFVEDGAELEIVCASAAAPAPAPDNTPQVPAAAVSAPEVSKPVEAAPQAKLAAKESTVRVPAARLDRLVNLIGELVMNQSRLTDTMSRMQVPELANPVQEIERIVSELRNDVLSIRMLPIGTLFGRFRRLVHDLSRELGKEIELVTEGEDTELDKSILDALGEPLVHLLRNSIDHGIEAPELRVQRGKPRQGTIRLSAIHTGATVVIRIEDDGGGVNREKVRARAVERQLIASDSKLSDKALLNLLMLPGFSTAATISNISGRGVGMDVVKRQIESLRGTLSIASEEERGTEIALTLPLTLAIIEGLLVEIGQDRFIFPLSSVTENVELSASDRERANGRNVVSVRGEPIAYIDLRELFDVKGERPEIEKIVLAEHEGQRIGLVVDRVLGTYQTVLQPLGRFLRKVAVASGATILGDGGVALVIDLISTIQLANCQAASAQEHSVCV